jgi:hypothetical protein
MIVCAFGFIGVVGSEVSNDFLVDEVVDKEEVVLEEFFQEVELARLVVVNDIV